MNEHSEGGYPLAYLITIRTYGTWLHGDEKTSVDRHGFNTYGKSRISYSRNLKKHMEREMKDEPFVLNAPKRECLLETINEVCKFRGYELFAVNIRTNHFHVVVAAKKNPNRISLDFKTYATRNLRERGLIGKERKVWARGKSRRYLWKPRHVEIAIDYVNFGQGKELPNFD